MNSEPLNLQIVKLIRVIFDEIDEDGRKFKVTQHWSFEGEFLTERKELSTGWEGLGQYSDLVGKKVSDK